MQLHAVFPSTPNKLWVRNTSCFCQNCFRTSFKPETACAGWRMFDLQRKRNPSILSSSEKAVEIPENVSAIVSDINDHVAAVYDRKIYIGKVLGSMILMLKSHFMNMLGLYQQVQFFASPKRGMTKRGKKFEKFVLETVMGKFFLRKYKN